MTVHGYAPASIGNVAAGFDALGVALEPVDGSPFGDVVRVAPGTGAFEVTGLYADLLPKDPDRNLVRNVQRLYEKALEARGRELPPIDIVLEKNLPIASGLGSSSSSIVAALAALDRFAGGPVDRQELLAIAGRAEAGYAGAVHLDNVAPALLGGLQLVGPGTRSLALPWPDDLLFVVVHPDFQLSTAAARHVLPASLARPLAIEFGQNLAAFVHALHVGDRGLLRATLHDAIAEPHRAALVPGFRAAQAGALAVGALGCSLSGSGPSIFAVAAEPDAPRVTRAIVDAFARAGLDSDPHVCRASKSGAVAWTEEG